MTRYIVTSYGHQLLLYTIVKFIDLTLITCKGCVSLLSINSTTYTVNGTTSDNIHGFVVIHGVNIHVNDTQSKHFSVEFFSFLFSRD